MLLFHMLLFDLCTFVLLLAAISILQAVILVFFSRLMGRRYPGLDLWAWASISNALGFMLLRLRGFIPDLWSIVIANTLLISSTALNLSGINRFLDRRHPFQEGIALSLKLSSPLLLAFFTFVMPRSPNA